MAEEKQSKHRTGGQKMEELKKRLIEACERKLNYYDIVNEPCETVEYGLIIDFLVDSIEEMIMWRAEDG